VKQVGRRPYVKVGTGKHCDHHAFMFPGAKSCLLKGDVVEFELHDKHGGDWDEWPEHLRVREFPQERPC
jgi:hypothetical protein